MLAFPIQESQREPIGLLPPPSNLTVTVGPRRGEWRATAVPVTGAAIDNWQISSAANPAEVVQSIQTTAANCTFASLTPGAVYRVVVNAVGAVRPSSWSEPVPQMAV